MSSKDDSSKPISESSYWVLILPSADEKPLLVQRYYATDAIRKVSHLNYRSKRSFLVGESNYQDKWDRYSNRFSKEWAEKNLPKKFNLKLLAQSGSIDIYDSEGTNITSRFACDNPIKTSAKLLGGSTLLGLELACAQQLNNVVYENLKRVLIDKLGANPDAFKDKKVQEIIKLILPIISHPLASHLEERHPHAKYVKKYAELSITNSATQISTDILDAFAEFFSVMFSASGEISCARIAESSKEERFEEEVGDVFSELTQPAPALAL
jgi:hypothetical protein